MLREGMIKIGDIRNIVPCAGDRGGKASAEATRARARKYINDRFSQKKIIIIIKKAKEKKEKEREERRDNQKYKRRRQHAPRKYNIMPMYETIISRLAPRLSI